MSCNFTLENSDKLISNIFLKLVANQKLLKCLKYPTRDALYKPDLSQDEVSSLIDNSDPKEIRISFAPFNLATTEAEKSEIRIFIKQFSPENIYISNVYFVIQVICSNQIWLMDEGRVRPLAMIQEILKEINGTEIESIGNVYVNTPIRIYNYNTYFSGYEIYPETKLG
jgi:hypothetical protein